MSDDKPKSAISIQTIVTRPDVMQKLTTMKTIDENAINAPSNEGLIRNFDDAQKVLNFSTKIDGEVIKVSDAKELMGLNELGKDLGKNIQCAVILALAGEDNKLRNRGGDFNVLSEEGGLKKVYEAAIKIAKDNGKNIQHKNEAGELVDITADDLIKANTEAKSAATEIKTGMNFNDIEGLKETCEKALSACNDYTSSPSAGKKQQPETKKGIGGLG